MNELEGKFTDKEDEAEGKFTFEVEGKFAVEVERKFTS